MIRLDSQEGESALAYQERVRDRSSLQESYPDEETTNRLKAARRLAYVRQHAPVLLSGLLARNIDGASDGQIREHAIREAGFLFDETEPKA